MKMAYFHNDQYLGGAELLNPGVRTVPYETYLRMTSGKWLVKRPTPPLGDVVGWFDVKPEDVPLKTRTLALLLS